MRDKASWEQAEQSDGSEGSAPEEAPTFASQKRPRTAGSESDVESLDDYESSSEESESEGEELADKVADIPLGRRTALAANGVPGRGTLLERARSAKAADAKRPKRASKDAPAEQSSKRPVPILRDTLQMAKRHGKDPRFESLSGGPFKEERFKKLYSFVYDEQLPEERKDLKSALKKAKSPAARAKIQADLTRTEQAIRSEQTRRWKKDFYDKLKTQERDAVKEGKSPYYLKKSEQRKLELLAKYEELKSSGRLEKFMDKRREKNAKKEHKHLVPRRNAEEA